MMQIWTAAVATMLIEILRRVAIFMELFTLTEICRFELIDVQKVECMDQSARFSVRHRPFEGKTKANDAGI